MSGRAARRVVRAAHAVALRLRLGEAVAGEIKALCAQAVAVLEADDPLRLVIEALAGQIGAIRRDGAALREAGQALHDAVERALRPAPPGAGRRDIDG